MPPFISNKKRKNSEKEAFMNQYDENEQNRGTDESGDSERRENGYYHREGGYRPYNENNSGNGGYNGGYVPLHLPPENSGLATGALVCGILGILFSCCCGLGVLPAVIGLILALVDRKNYNGMSGMALGALVCSIIGIVVSVAMIVVMAVGFSSSSDLFFSIYESVYESIEESMSLDGPETPAV